ncbi:unnamed protein product [Clonostachys solani]|uniref:Uncharacterized protein n=1 Tax=Clonostachys solani TaxID=160281 RepID=A0A9P0ENP6_9HYPO|nr:unnamed protein product [Clonostachys solani]
MRRLCYVASSTSSSSSNYRLSRTSGLSIILRARNSSRVSLVEILMDILKDPTLKDAVLVVDALDECITDRP